MQATFKLSLFMTKASVNKHSTVLLAHPLRVEFFPKVFDFIIPHSFCFESHEYLGQCLGTTGAGDFH